MAAGPKTKPTKASVPAFLRKAAGERLPDCHAVARLMAAATGKKPVMWGDAIVGFDTNAVAYAGGRTEDWPLVAFSPRRSALVLYMARRYPRYDALVRKLGKHKQAGGCLHIRSLADVDVDVLAEMIGEAVKARRTKS
ncbi:MAG TPA: hypothetical protein VG916_02860 [Gemmatimonadaceae bacterium]|nr:hypothetical protein [Gemmatimonadaceae bacterium]